MDFVDEQQVTGLQVHQQADDVARPLQRRGAGDPALHPHFLGQHQSHRGFTQAWRAIKQHMVQGLLPPLSRLHSKLAQHLLQLRLTDVVRQGVAVGALHRHGPSLPPEKTDIQDPLLTGLGSAGVGGDDRHSGRVPSPG